jgi:hypothetical protein
MNGPDLAAVQPIMAAHYLKREVERLHFGPPASRESPLGPPCRRLVVLTGDHTIGHADG